jgi:hypothetical protein
VDGEGQSTSSTYENNTNKEDHEQNPWSSSLFDDMQLDEVKNYYECSKSYIIQYWCHKIYTYKK